ncbi:BglG family transcription antiterminator [Streptococcus sp. zg-JUN1979]|uniref:BglG family transcription antiterminator n=1 Tax=Streptococcus sp. zg-JUN1979 TaxID=3391450 RepID=UPI0039A4E3DD
MLDKRQRQLVKLLEEVEEDFVSAKLLADALGCSDKTVRNDLNRLADMFLEYEGLQLIRKKGKGYQLKVINSRSYHMFLKDYGLAIETSLPKTVMTADDRYYYLLNRLIIEEKALFFDDLVEELYVSRSTLSHDFKNLRKALAPYSLRIESKANKGVYVCGLERDKRRFIMDYFLQSEIMTSFNQYVDNQFLSQLITLEELTIIVLDECREHDISLSDFVMSNLVVHIALATRRVAEGFEIASLPVFHDLSSYPIEKKTASCILKRLSGVTGLAFPKEEVDYVALHLISKANHRKASIAQTYNDRIHHELRHALSQLKPAIQEDARFYQGVVEHLVTLLIRLEHQATLENPLKQQIIKEYQSMFDIADKTMRLMPSFSDYHVTEDEIAYIALHFMAARERLKEERKYRVLVICATGYGSAQMLRSRLVKELGTSIHIVDVIGYYEISDERLEGVDFIVSAIDLSHVIFSMPVFHVSIFLSDIDITRIKEGMRHLEHSQGSFQENSSIPQPLTEVFDHYFSEDSFHIMTDDVSKDELLEQLIASIAAGEEADFINRMRSLIDQREAMSSVLFSSHMAIPHPIHALSDKHRIAVGLIRNGGLRWDEQHPEVNLIFLTSMSVYDNEGLAEIASQLVDIAENKHLQEKILACQTFLEFKQLFLQLEKGEEI